MECRPVPYVRAREGRKRGGEVGGRRQKRRSKRESAIARRGVSEGAGEGARFLVFHFLSSYITLCSTRHQINNGPTYPILSQPEQVRAVCRLCVPAPCALATSLPRVVSLFFLFLLLSQPLPRERDRRVSPRLSSRSFVTLLSSSPAHTPFHATDARHA